MNEDPKDDYLWDRSGPPDPEVARLEKLLGRFALPAGRPLPLPARSPWPRVALAMAASLLIAVAGWVLLRRPAGTGYLVTRMEGDPRIGERALGASGRLGGGDWLSTDARSRAEIQVANIGTVDVLPSSRVRLVASDAHQQRLELGRGSIAASVNAPPRIFMVDTPAARAVDLGCSYRMQVDSAGNGTLFVDVGQVSLEGGGHDSLVPAEALCLTRRGKGPGTPFFRDCGGSFRDALERLDFDDGGEEALQVVLRQSRPRDSLTLWHLLKRVDPGQRPEVAARLAELSAPPPGIGITDAVGLDPEKMGAWRNSLERTWDRPGDTLGSPNPNKPR